MLKFLSIFSTDDYFLGTNAFPAVTAMENHCAWADGGGWRGQGNAEQWGQGQSKRAPPQCPPPIPVCEQEQGKKAKSLDIREKMKTIPGTKERGSHRGHKVGSRSDDNQGSIVAAPIQQPVAWGDQLLKITNSRPQELPQSSRNAVCTFLNFFVRFLESPDHNAHSARELLISIST